MYNVHVVDTTKWMILHVQFIMCEIANTHVHVAVHNTSGHEPMKIPCT